MSVTRFASCSLLCLGFLLPSSGIAQVKEWVARYRTPARGYNAGTAVTTDALGNVYVTGTCAADTTPGTTDLATIKYDKDGNEVWVATYDGPANDYDGGADIALDESRNVYVTGWSRGFETGSATIKYDNDGNLVWLSRHRGSARALALDAAGNVYVAGSGGGYRTTKFDNDGNELWSRTTNSGAPAAMTLDDNSNIYMTGESGTVKYDTNGNMLWAVRADMTGRAVALGKDGHLYVAGTVGYYSSSDFATIKLDSSGNQLWEARYDGEGNWRDGATDLAIGRSDSIYVTGLSDGPDKHYDYVTVKYRQDGQEVWVARYEGWTNWYECEGLVLALDRSENVYVAGSKYWYKETGFDWTTVKYDRHGTEDWVNRHRAAGFCWDKAYAITTDARGNVYLTGQTNCSPESNYLETIKYSSATLPVQIDIKPGSFPNSVNPRSSALVPVALLTTSVADGDEFDFDATRVDSASVQFGPHGAHIAHTSGHIEDVDADGDLDLVTHFRTRETGIACGDTSATLTAETLDGDAIEGEDSLNTVGCR